MPLIDMTYLVFWPVFCCSEKSKTGEDAAIKKKSGHMKAWFKCYNWTLETCSIMRKQFGELGDILSLGRNVLAPGVAQPD